MRQDRVLALLAGLGLAITPVLATAQEVAITRSVLPDLPYTLIYPTILQASGGGADPITLNHPDAPLQCEMFVVPVDDAAWTPESALEALADDEVVSGWSETLPGLTLSGKSVAQYQDVSALQYEGTSETSAMGMPLTLVHTEAVSGGRGYVLDCIFAADQATQARPIVDFIIANFSTRADADCCAGTEPPTDETASP